MGGLLGGGIDGIPMYTRSKLIHPIFSTLWPHAGGSNTTITAPRLRHRTDAVEHYDHLATAFQQAARNMENSRILLYTSYSPGECDTAVGGMFIVWFCYRWKRLCFAKRSQPVLAAPPMIPLLPLTRTATSPPPEIDNSSPAVLMPA